MKRILFVVSIMIFISTSCMKKICDVTTCQNKECKKMIVIKACEGAFLRLDNIDYEIGNEACLDNYSNYETVEANFILDNTCLSSRTHCAMVHINPKAIGFYRLLSINHISSKNGN